MWSRNVPYTGWFKYETLLRSYQDVIIGSDSACQILKFGFSLPVHSYAANHFLLDGNNISVCNELAVMMKVFLHDGKEYDVEISKKNMVIPDVVKFHTITYNVTHLCGNERTLNKFLITFSGKIFHYYSKLSIP